MTNGTGSAHLPFAAVAAMPICCSPVHVQHRGNVAYPSTDIQKTDTCLLGATIQSAMARLNLAPTQGHVFDEPPLILRGISTRLADTCEIALCVARASIVGQPTMAPQQRYAHLADKPITGLSRAGKKANKSGTLRR